MYPLTIENIEKENPPAHRNVYLANILSKTQYMEHVGRGITRMKESMIEHGLPAPIFEENNNFFKVTLCNPHDDNTNKSNNYNINDIITRFNLNNRQKEILIQMPNIRKINYQTYEKMFNVSNSTAVRDLNKLVKDKILIKVKKHKEVFFELMDEN